MSTDGEAGGPLRRDEAWMRVALRMAGRGLGTTAPNPSVGAVLVQPGGGGGVLVGRGWTAPGGRPHAETEALRRAGDAARGATAYVTLEPCSHHGRTPPCAEALIAAGVRRVVVGCGDPDPRVAGRGLAMLRAAGLEVRPGVLAGEARWLTAGHILRVRHGRPFVQVKMALGADGGVARGDGGPVWVTGPEARAAGHLLRAMADAILVGAGTVADDDPELTCRLPGLGSRSPVRVVLGGRRGLSPGSRLARTAQAVPTWLLGAAGRADPEAGRLTELGVRVTLLAGDGEGAGLPAALRALADAGITRLLVEGGPTVWRSFLAAGLADEVVLFRAGAGAPLAGGLADMIDPARLVVCEERPVGADRCIVYRRRDWGPLLGPGDPPG